MWEGLFRVGAGGQRTPLSDRLPQYVAFVLVMFGFLLQWPTLITLIMFPVLLIVYARLARREELDAIEAFGDAYRSYRDRTPAFIPRLR